MHPADLQRLINSGVVWSLEGSMGRAAMRAIDDGACMLGQELQVDYWGNIIPSRTDVMPGTKGSFDYVEARMGSAYAEEIAAITASPLATFMEDYE